MHELYIINTFDDFCSTRTTAGVHIVVSARAATKQPKQYIKVVNQHD